jgi:hypothetical protein
LYTFFSAKSEKIFYLFKRKTIFKVHLNSNLFPLPDSFLFLIYHEKKNKETAVLLCQCIFWQGQKPLIKNKNAQRVPFLSQIGQDNAATWDPPALVWWKNCYLDPSTRGPTSADQQKMRHFFEEIA